MYHKYIYIYKYVGCRHLREIDIGRFFSVFGWFFLECQSFFFLRGCAYYHPASSCASLAPRNR